MPSVTIDLEDLETLVFTTGALKTIEGALANRRVDPFTRPHLDFTAAHDRCASAMRNARRVEAGTVVAWDGELSEAEVTTLRKLEMSSCYFYHTPIHNGESILEGLSALAAKGCVVMGTFGQFIVWAGASTPEMQPQSGYAVKITPRGREKLAKIDAEKANGP